MAPSVLIVGAGPAGLATAACLTSLSIPYTLLEQHSCAASMWKTHTYDCLHLHLPKQECQLPLFPFPKHYPKYPSRNQTVAYLDEYAHHFNIRPVFNTRVIKAHFSHELMLWVVMAEQEGRVVTFGVTFLVVATGENDKPVFPILPGSEEFQGKMIHGREYRNGGRFGGRKVLVVGTGNTGMDIALDLANSGAEATLVARGQVHVMPRDVFGLHCISTFGVSRHLLKVFPVWLVDKILVLLSWLTLGSAAKYKLVRPEEGPLALKARTGRTPVLDVGTVQKIKSGEIKVMPGIERLTASGARFVNGEEEDFDAVIMATGYESTFSIWLKGDGMFGDDGFPKGWKGEQGLYAVGFGRRGLAGCAQDALHVAQHVAKKCHLNNREQCYLR